jgi:hypothetical protein
MIHAGTDIKAVHLVEIAASSVQEVKVLKNIEDLPSHRRKTLLLSQNRIFHTYPRGSILILHGFGFGGDNSTESEPVLVAMRIFAKTIAQLCHGFFLLPFGLQDFIIVSPPRHATNKKGHIVTEVCFETRVSMPERASRSKLA